MGISDKTQKSTQSQLGMASTRIPDTPDIIAARADKPQIDPSIGYRLGEKERQLENDLSSPLGGATTPQIRDAIRRSERRELMSQAGQQTREGAYDVNRLNQTKNLALAGLTRGTDEKYSSEGQSKVVQSESPWAIAARTAAQAAPISL